MHSLIPCTISIFPFSYSFQKSDMDSSQDDEAPKDPGAHKIIQGFDEKDFEGETLAAYLQAINMQIQRKNSHKFVERRYKVTVALLFKITQG